jgi:repressor of nif and glnA expression
MTRRAYKGPPRQYDLIWLYKYNDRNALFMTKTEISILSVLKERQHEIIGSRQIMRELVSFGIDLTERTIRYHLKIMDEKGLTTVFGKNGRKITDKGLDELLNSNVSEKLGFISSKIDSLAFMSDFDCSSQVGKVVLNVSMFSASSMSKAKKILSNAFRSKYVMSDRIILAQEGESIGNTLVPEGMIGLGTICSVTVNSVLLKNGIPIASKYGGVMEVTPDNGPIRFTSLISYDGCSLDPLIIFIKSAMTSVNRVLNDEPGSVLASFREVPVACIEKTRSIQDKLHELGIKGLLLIGNPNNALLEVPVGQDKAGVVVIGGLNTVAALYEQGIQVESYAMSELVEYGEMVLFNDAFKSV